MTDEVFRRRLLRGMIGELHGRLLPQLQTADARDSAESIIRTLALLAVEDELPADLVESYAADIDATPSGTGSPAAQLDLLRSLAASRLTAAEPGAFAGQVVRAERKMQAALGKSRDAISNVAPTEQHTTAEGVEDPVPRRLEAYLRQRFPDAPELRVVEAAVVPGGRSKETYKVRLDDTGGHLPERCVLRMDREVALMNTRAVNEFELLECVARLGLPVPAPLLAEGDESWLGGTFLLVGLVEGEKAGEYFPEVAGPGPGHQALGHDLAAMLGLLHSRPVGDLGWSTAPAPTTIDDVAAAIEQAHALLSASGAAVPEFHVAHQWLLEHLYLALDEPRLQHGDVGLHNLLIRDGRLVAVLDWELAAVGPPAADVASCRHLVETLMPWDDFAESYLAAGGPPSTLRAEHLDFHTVLRAYRTVATSHTCRAMYASGRTDDFVLANAGFDFAARTRWLLVRALDRVLTPDSVVRS
jgi:aminoglycoside phosphotransferase (APT) family kinase protein